MMEKIEKAKLIKLLVLDVDGVMTDGGILYTADGEEIKRFDVQDGHGIKLFLRAGIDVAIITGRRSKVVDIRAADLGIELVYQKALKKTGAYEDILQKRQLTDAQVAVMGDDLPDLPLVRRCGLSFTVPDAVEEVKREADIITKRRGGRGAVREACEYILKAQDLWDRVTQRYYRPDDENCL